MLWEELASKLDGKTVVGAVGNPERGDDGIGPLVAKLLKEAGVEAVIETGTTQALGTHSIRKLEPNDVLFVDAVDFGGSPGDMSILGTEDLSQSAMDTHRMPLRLAMSCLERDLKTRCYLLAIQPDDIRQGAGMTEEVRYAGASLAAMLLRDVFKSDKGV